MTAPIGTRLGSYEILAALGAGGMGEVYRARDTKLDRDVAIKILSQAFASDADRLARFEREAKMLAALNHPHIAQIYGLETIGAGGHALILELVEGDDHNGSGGGRSPSTRRSRSHGRSQTRWRRRTSTASSIAI